MMGELPHPRTAPTAEVLRHALASVESGRRVVLATVVQRKGSTPSTPGQKLVLVSATEAVGTIGGGAVELHILRLMAAELTGGSGQPRTETVQLGAALGMCCGGSVEVLIETLEPPASVVLVGAGHIGRALLPLLESLGFRVALCDAREQLEAFGDELVGHERTTFFEDYEDPGVVELIGAVECSAALVMTHDHQLDQDVIEWALTRGFGFVGGVGSRAKAARTRTRLVAKSFPESDTERVRMPLGVDIAARSPAEIAVSIAAELVKWRAALVGSRSRATP